MNKNSWRDVTEAELVAWWMAEVHACYRCGKPTTLGTAWCQICLDEAADNRRKYPPRKKLPLPHVKRYA